MAGTMRLAVCDGPGHIEIRERPIPSANSGKILVRVTICGVCASDLAAWRGSRHVGYPYSPGHEFCGIVERLGDDVVDLDIGERVVINPNLGCGECPYCRASQPHLCDFLKTRPIKTNGGFSEYASLDYRMIHPLPQSLPDELAPFVEPLSCAIHVAGKARPESAETVVVFGGGTMGILAGLALKSWRCQLVFVEPLEERRRQLSKLFGVSAMSPEQLDHSALSGTVHVAIDCSGDARAVAQAIKTLRKTGRLVLAGLAANAEEVSLPLLEVTTKELRIEGAVLNPSTFQEAIRLAVEETSALKALTTETYALDNIEAAFQRASCRVVHKVLVRP